MADWVFLNDAFLKEEKALIHFSDLSVQRGYGIFDFFRLAGNRPLFLEDHLARFYASAQAMHLPVLLQKRELKEAIFQLVERNGFPNAGVRISLTGGSSDNGYTIGKPNLILSQNQFSPPSDEQREKGIRLITHSYQRQLPHVKTIDYLMAIWLQPTLKEKGADDLLYHHNGLVAECPRSNFFLVTADGRIVTPAEDVLQGITQKKVIELARKHYSVDEREVGLAEIKTAKEAFVTSSIKQVLPVAGIDETVFPQRAVGRHLQALFQNACEASVHEEAQTFHP